LTRCVAKRIGPRSGANGELRLEIFNLFNQTNFAGSAMPNASIECVDRGGQGSARSTIHGGCRRPVRQGVAQPSALTRRPRDEPSNSVGVPVQFLRQRLRNPSRSEGRARPALCFGDPNWFAVR
jgi:hypothetical protein